MTQTSESRKSRVGSIVAVFSTALVLVAIAFASHGSRTTASAEPATTILVNGRIYTSNPTQPWAEAIAIRGNRIAAVGASKDVLALRRGPQTKVIDLGGRMAMPGIIDTHTHFVEGSEILAGVSVAGAESIDAVKARLAEFAKTHPGDGWIFGGGWDYGSFWPGGLPTKEILDGIFPNRPVVLVSSDGHSVWANSAALGRAKITRSTPNPDTPELRGIIIHDAKTGEPTGVLEEGAQYLVNAALDDQTVLQDLRDGTAAANRQGITGVINATGDSHEFGLYEALRDRGELTVRMTTSMSNGVGSKHTVSDAEVADLEKLRAQYAGDWVRFGAVKFFADGVVETHTAAMLAPYANAVTPGEKGTMLYTPDELKRDYQTLDKHGFQVMTHAVGDGAVREVLDAYEAVAKEDGPRDRRWRIEHMEVVAAPDRPRLAQLHVLAAFQPWCCASLEEPWGAGVGTVRMADGIPWHDVVAAGATLIMGSDWPVEPINPFVIMQTGVTRQTADGQPAGGFYPKQSLTLDEMLPGYTRNAAYAEFMGDRLGQLKPGYFADVIVLSQDLYKIPANTIGKTEVLLTIVDGKIVNRKGI
jgi:predicted amidohydrolase YtcJ